MERAVGVDARCFPSFLTPAPTLLDHSRVSSTTVPVGTCDEQHTTVVKLDPSSPRPAGACEEAPP